jgi:WD40 repeat protein
VKPKIEVKRHGVYSGHSGSIYSMALIPGENTFLTAGGDGVIALWNLNNDIEGKQYADVGKIVYSIAYDLESNMLLAGQYEGGIHVIDLKKGKEERLLQYHQSPVYKISVNHEHNLIISLDGNGELVISSLNGFEIKKNIKISQGKLRSIAFNNSNDIVAIGSAEGAIHLYNISDWNKITTIQAHEPGFSVNALKYSPDGKFLISGSRDAHLNIFDVLNNFEKVRSIPAHNYAIYSIDYSHDGRFIATASRDKTVKIWDSGNFDMIKKIEKEQMNGHVISVNTLLWHPNGYLITAGDDRSAISWEVK